MKNKLYIVAFLVLFLTSGGIAFFVKKQLDKKNLKSKEPAPTVEEPATKPREIETPKQDLNIDSSIEVEAIDTVNKTFTYTMTYNGIAETGTFKDGDEDLKITKSFGSFVIDQREPDVTLLAPIQNSSTKTGAQKAGGGDTTTKSGATKLGKTGDTVFDLTTSRPVAKVVNSHFVDLVINHKHGVLHSLTVNLATGEKIGSKAPRNWDGD